MRVIVTLKRHRRVRKRAIHGITDHPGNDSGFLTAFVVAISCSGAQRRQRNECAKYPNNSGHNRGHQEVGSPAPVNANLPATQSFKMPILTLIYCASWLNAAFA